MSWLQQDTLAQQNPPQATPQFNAAMHYTPGSLPPSATPSTLNSLKQQQQQTVQQQYLGHLNNNQSTQSIFQQQNCTMMQTPSTTKWPQQQNANAMYQQTPAMLNNWQQPDLQAAPTLEQLPQATQQQDQKGAANYGAYLDQPAHDINYMQQLQYQPDASFVSYHQTPPQNLQQQNVPNFLEVGNSNNDGWGDWDWSDSTNNNNSKMDAEEHRQAEYNSNCIENSFSSEGKDAWQWNALEENSNQTGQQHQLPPKFETGNTSTIVPPTQFQQPSASKVPIQSPKYSQNLTSMVKPIASAPPAPTAVATKFNAPVKTDLPQPFAEALNENFNTVAVAAASTTANIPSSVYVSQAKPVSKPPRQYASPPGVTPTDFSEDHVEPPTALPAPRSLLMPTVTQPDQPTAQKSTLAMAAIDILPPPIISNTSAGNPFKRAGAPSNRTISPPLPLPPPDFANPICPAIADSTEPDNSEILHENQEVIVPASTAASQTITLPSARPPPATAHPPPPNDERNQYLQTSHLSENPDEEVNVEAADSFPPPGLSRLVLGQPELAASQRMVTGTDDVLTVAVGNINSDERHADGEDTSSDIVQSNAVNPASEISIAPTTNIDITTDRNLYMVAGSNSSQEHRVVTGVERFMEPAGGSQIINEQREIELDGENLEDQQLQQPLLVAASRNEPPLEGAAASATPSSTPAVVTTVNLPDTVHDTITPRDQSNISTGNDESDQLNEHHRYMKSSRKHESHALDKKLEKKRKEKQRSVDPYESEDSDDNFPSEHERSFRRSYREGSARSERDKERDFKEKKSRRDVRQGSDLDEDSREITYSREKHRLYNESNTSRSERRSQRYNRYDADSKYETEESTRHEAIARKDRRNGRGDRERARAEERNTRSDRSERDYDDYRRYHHQTLKREGKRIDGDDRRDIRERRDVYAEDDRRRRTIGGNGTKREKDYREDFASNERRRRSDKHRSGNPIEYEEYRNRSSRNTREGDADKDRRNMRQASGMYGAYPPTAYGYDPYAFYYEQMARTNPQAYAEWYKKYYGPATTLTHGHDFLSGSSTAPNNDDRESVHSGRSSTNLEKERFTNAYILQANEYHRHFMHQQQQQQQLAANLSNTFNSTMLEESSFAGSHSNKNYLCTQSGGRLMRSNSQVHATAADADFYTGPVAAANVGLSYYARSNNADSRSGNLSQHDPAETIATDPPRLTPCKFINEHAVVSFCAGVLVTVKTKNTSNGPNNIVKLMSVSTNDATRQLFQAFPGPLVRGLTHKKTIIEFCEDRIRLGPNNTTTYAKQVSLSNASKYKASYTLMWNLLILLLRQNGMVVGTDIAELLLRNQVEFPHKPQSDISNSDNSSNSKSESDSNEEVDLKDSDDADSNGGEPGKSSLPAPTEQAAQNGEDSAASTSKTTTTPSSSSEEEITAKFRNYLLYGNVNEALDWATDNNLWGHALFLASKVDRRSHANVMMKFANKLALNDPLQTLYQLMSGRTPSSVTSVQDERWGDWRPHLSMILSNTSQKPELDRKAITTLGDSLFHRGDLYAAHFCYLMAQVGFGRYQDSAAHETTLQQSLPKLVLLGSSHYKSFMEFATNESIMMTEIYEYACSLNDDKFSLIEFQPYKYLMASRFLDYGYHLKSLMYMEQISAHIERDPSKFEYTFIKKVYDFADRLKFYDPMLEKTLYETQTIDGNLNNSPQSFEEQKWLQVLRALVFENTTNFNTGEFGGVQGNYQREMAEINKQFNELNMQYQNINSTTEPIIYNADQLQQQTLVDSESVDVYSQQQQSPNAENAASTQYSQQVYDSGANFDQYVPQNQPQQQQQSLYYEPTQQQTDYTANEGGVQNSGSYDYWGGQQQSQVATEERHHLEEAVLENISTNVAADMNSPVVEPPATHISEPVTSRSSFNNNISIKNVQYESSKSKFITSNGESFSAIPDKAKRTSPFQPWNEADTAADTVRPTISMPNTRTFYDDSDTAAQQQQSKSQTEQGSSISNKKQSNESKNNKSSQVSSNQNSGWFGGIWNKLSLKPKNQMILPDDKNPAIVWDSEKKRWVNTDGGDDSNEDIVKPPPKMNDIIPHQQQQQPHNQVIQQQQLQQPQQQDVSASPSLLQQYGGDVTHQQQQQTLQSPDLLSGASQTYSATSTNAAATLVKAETAAKAPSLQSNMFKMQRNRTLKNSYVDVFNPSGAPMSKAAESVLAPALPPAAVPAGSFFIPGAPSDSRSDSAAYQAQQQERPQQSQPQFYNPNQFGGPSGAIY